jgi:hypothetical protein
MPNRIMSAAGAAVLAATLLCGAAPAMVPTLPAPPPGDAQVNSTIFDAMLGIARSITRNPSGAQAATFPYTAAIQQYNAGNTSAAQRSALQAISTAAIVPLPQDTIAPPAIPQPPVVQMMQINNVPQGDAEEYLALAWRTLSGQCGSLNVNPGAEQLKAYQMSVADYAGRKYAAVISETHAIVNACAPALAQTTAQSAAQSTAAPAMPPITPELIVTPGPDPALQPQSPQP